MSDVDYIAALVEVLSEEASITDLVGTRIFGMELHPDEARLQPRKAIVIQPISSPGSFDYIRYGPKNVDLYQYGETPYEALRLRLVVHPFLKQLLRRADQSTVINSLVRIAGPVYLRDNETDWPFVLDTWQVHAAEVALS